MEKRSIRIREVAADAGVGTATVSRVLNEPWRVSLHTIERVKSSIDELECRPNFRARLLARGSSGTICFLLSNRPFIGSIHAPCVLTLDEMMRKREKPREPVVLPLRLVVRKSTAPPLAQGLLPVC